MAIKCKIRVSEAYRTYKAQEIILDLSPEREAELIEKDYAEKIIIEGAPIVEERTRKTRKKVAEEDGSQS